MSVTELPPEVPASGEPPESDGPSPDATDRRQPRWWRAWWWSVALFGTALTSWVFTSGGMKGIITLAVICIAIVAGVASWKFLHRWFFSAPPDELHSRSDRYLEHVVGSAVRRPTVPFQVGTIVIVALVAALASFFINGLDDLKWWATGILAVLAVFTLIVVRNRALFALFVVIGSIAIPLVKSWGPLYMFQWNWNILAPGLYTSTVDLAVLILYIVWWRSGTLGADLKRAFGHWATWLPFLGLLSMVPSVIGAQNHYLAITQFHRFLWPVLIYLYLVGRVRHRSHLWAILGAFMIIIVVQVPVVLMQYKTGGVGPLDFLEVAPTDKQPGQASLPTDSGRPMGTFIHPAVLGSVLGSFALMLCAIGASMNARNPLRYVLFASAPMACLPIVLSHTRSPFLAILVMGLVLIGVVVYRGWMSWRTIAVWFLVLFIGLGMFHEKVESTIGSQITSERVYQELQARVRLSSIARRMTMDTPVYGIGLNNFQQANRSEEYRRENLLFVHNVHNFYVLMLVETGFLGLITTYIIGLSLFVLSYRLSRSKDWFFRGVGLGALVFFGFLAMEAGLSFLLRMDQLNAYFWVVAGMVVACLHMDGRLRPENAVFGGPKGRGDDEPDEIGRPTEPVDDTVAIGPTTLVPINVPRRFVPIGRRRSAPRTPVPAMMRAMRDQQRHGRHARPPTHRERQQQRRARSQATSRGAGTLIDRLAVPFRALRRPTSGPTALLAGAAADGGGRIRGHARPSGGFGRRYVRPTAVLAILFLLGASQAVTAAPELATDGMRIAFAAVDDRGSHGIYVAEGDGSGVRRITPDDGRSYSVPTWSRNGNAIVYLAGEGGLRSDIEIMAPDGSGAQTVLADQAVRSAVMSADGRSIFFSSSPPGGGPSGIYSVDLETLSVAPIDAGGTANRNGVSRSGAGDRIVYTRQDPQSSPDVWIDDAIGGPRPLVAHRFADFNPSLSHDGSRVVVSRNEQNGLAILPRVLITDLIAQSGWKLLNIDPASGDTVELTRGENCTLRAPANPCDPTEASAFSGRWTPDGSTIGFLAKRSAGTNCLCLVSADGSTSDVLIERSDLELRGWDWAVPGPAPAAAVTDIGATAGRPELLVAGVGLDGSTLRRVSPDGWRVETIDTGGLIPSWAEQSDDGSVIVFSAQVPYDPAAAAPNPPPPAGQQRSEHLTVETILSLSELPEDRPEIGEEQVFVLRDDAVTQVTDPWNEDWRVGVGPDDHRGNTDPSISPDGRTLVVTNRSAVANESFLLRIDLQSGEVLNLTNGTAGAQRVDDNFPEISPDGRQVAFSFTDDSGTDIHLMDTASGTDFRSVTDDAFFNTMPTWSPDGRSIAYVSNRNYTEEQLIDAVVYGDGEIPLDGWVIVRHDLASGAETNLTAADQSPTLFPSWSPDGSMVAFIGGGPGLTDVDVVRADGGGSVEGFVDTPDIVETSVDWE